MSNANDRELAAWVLEATDVIIRIGLIAVGAYVAGRILSKIVDRVFQPRNGDKAKFLGDQRKLGTLRSHEEHHPLRPLLRRRSDDPV